jgi:hypothetical protein
MWSFFMFNELRNNVVVCFVDIGGIVDIHCLYIFIYLFRKLSLYPFQRGQPLPRYDSLYIINQYMSVYIYF